jgi:hypothetical protein
VEGIATSAGRAGLFNQCEVLNLTRTKAQRSLLRLRADSVSQPARWPTEGRHWKGSISDSWRPKDWVSHRFYRPSNSLRSDEVPKADT